MTKSNSLIYALTLGLLLATTGAQAATYVFTATCEGKKKIVEQWTAETVDPGKDALKAKTQEKHPGCTIGDYKAATDADALKNTQFYAPPEDPKDQGFFGGTKKTLCNYSNMC